MDAPEDKDTGDGERGESGAPVPGSLDTLVVEVESVLREGGEPASTVRTPGVDHSTVVRDLGERVQIHGRVIPDPPERLGAFRLGKHIGSGGMGAVFEAVHEKTGARAALKLVPCDEVKLVEALRQEVNGLARVNSPNIVGILDTGEEEGFAWAALEWLDGEDLATFSRKLDSEKDTSFHIGFESSSEGEQPASKPVSRTARMTPEGRRAVRGIPLSRAVQWFRDLARALHAMHTAGLLHRDINPRNIVIAGEMTPYLIDFGLAIRDDDVQGVRGHLAGTIPYMSPEQARLGWSGLTPSSDVYSLAVTFHEFLTGKRVVRESGYAGLDEVATRRVPSLTEVESSLPGSLNPIFRHATGKSVGARYKSAAELADDPRCLAGERSAETCAAIARRGRRPRNQEASLEVDRTRLHPARHHHLLRARALERTTCGASTRGASRRGSREDPERGERREARCAAASVLGFLDDGGDARDLGMNIAAEVARGSRERTERILRSLTFAHKPAELLKRQRKDVETARALIEHGFAVEALHVQSVVFELSRLRANGAEREIARARVSMKGGELPARLEVLGIAVDRLQRRAASANARWTALEPKDEIAVAVDCWARYWVMRADVREGKVKIEPDLTPLLAELKPWAEREDARHDVRALTLQQYVLLLIDSGRFEGVPAVLERLDRLPETQDAVFNDAINENRKALKSLTLFLADESGSTAVSSDSIDFAAGLLVRDPGDLRVVRRAHDAPGRGEETRDARVRVDREAHRPQR